MVFRSRDKTNSLRNKTYLLMKSSFPWLLCLCFILIACENKNAPRENTADPGPAIPADGLSVTGDFNADGRMDTLYEDFEVVEDSTGVGRCALASIHEELPALKPADGRCTGLQYLHNEGDLNEDGADELSLVRNWHTSFTRSVEIYSVQNGRWQELDHFTILVTALEEEPVQYTYEVLVVPLDTTAGYTVLEYDPVQADTSWVRRAGRLGEAQ